MDFSAICLREKPSVSAILSRWAMTWSLIGTVLPLCLAMNSWLWMRKNTWVREALSLAHAYRHATVRGLRLLSAYGLAQ